MKRIGFIDGRRIAGWRFQASATPGVGQIEDVTDPGVGATGSVTAKTLRYRPTGNKTGNIYSVARAIEVYPEGDTYILEGLSIYYDNPIGAGTFGIWWGLDIYMQAIGALAAVGYMNGITIGMNYTNATLNPVATSFIRAYTHGAVAMPSLINIGGSGMTNLVEFMRSVAPFLNGAVGVGQTARIRVHCNDTGQDWDIPLYQA